MGKGKKSKAPLGDYADRQKYFVNKQKLHIYFEKHLSKVPAQANIFIAHGIVEHSGTIQFQERVIPPLLKQNYNVYILDHQSHGKSEGLSRCYVEDFQDFVDDFNQFVAMILEEQKTTNETTNETPLPNFLIGHSMGGLVGFEVVNSTPDVWTGAVLNGAAFYIDPKLISPTMKFFIKKMAKRRPKLSAGEKTKESTNKLSHDPKIQEEALTDELRYQGKIKIRIAYEILHRISVARKRIGDFKTPVLLLHGGADEICLPVGSQQMYDGISSTDKTLKIFEGQLHETFSESSPDAVNTFIEWIGNHI